MENQGEFKYIIRRREDDNKRWEVVADGAHPAGGPVEGSTVQWKFQEDEAYEGLEAHFQFCHSVWEKTQTGVREVCFIGSEGGQINEDWAASIPNTISSKFLWGYLRPGSPQRMCLTYAVWVSDPKGISDFAIGENPPPKIDTGPR